MKKFGRNDPCPCGSGKKFKKCCESKMIGGRFMATKIEPTSAPTIASSVRMTGLFHSHVSIVQPSDATRAIKASSPSVEATSVPQPV